MKFNPYFNSYQNQQNSANNTIPYAQQLNNSSYMQNTGNNQLPAPLPGSVPEQGYYQSPYADFNVQQPQQNSYKSGGKVKNKASKESLPDLAERLRRQGRNGDTIIAHINPIEARLLKSLGGAGTKNPKTGVQEYFFKGVQNFVKNPSKTIGKTFKNPKRTIADAIGTAGALFGCYGRAAAAGALRSAIRCDCQNPLTGALKGAGYAGLANMGANLAGQGLSKLGAEGVGQALQNHAAGNSGWLGHVGNIGKGTAGSSAFSALDKAEKGGSMFSGVADGDSAGKGTDVLSAAEKEAITSNFRKKTAEEALIKSLQPKQIFLIKAGGYFTKPENLVAVGSLGLGAYGAMKKEKKPHEKSPEQIADEKKRYAKAMRLTPEEYREQKAYKEAMAAIRNNGDKNLTNTQKLYRKQSTPEEYQRTGKWLTYYDNPSFSGDPVYKKGGKVKSLIERLTINTPNNSLYLEGNTGGQDDKIPAMLSDGEYVIDASTVSDLGDGNNAAGARILDRLRESIRKHKRGGKMTLPPKAKPLIDYMR